ncbi:MAG: response regulator [Actinomycetota bacterium]|nr:response regulator [Actinomycetota bacterium]
MRILIAEDEKNFGFMLSRELSEDGDEVELASNGIDAVLGFIDRPADFVLLDINLPGLDGIGALRIIKKLAPQTRVLTISGNAGASQVEEAIRFGAAGCLFKPFAIPALKREMGILA